MGLFENTYIYGSNQWLTLQNKAAADPGGFTSEAI